MIDWLGRSPEVSKDGPDDPRVGVTGGSYGGALSLMLAGSDKRVDAIAPVITYNDLAQALIPNAAATSAPAATTPAVGVFAANGVFKKSWASLFFAEGLGGGPSVCGRFVAQVCQAYQELATTGTASQQTIDLLHADSPVSVTKNIKIPTLLVQGEQDTLFGLDQADANARQITAAGGQVKVIWYAGGHDGGQPDADLRAQIGQFFSYQLAHQGTDPGASFEYTVQGSLNEQGEPSVRTVTATGYPGLSGGSTQRQNLTLSGPAQGVINPAGGSPTAMSSLPGIGANLGPAAGRLTTDIPGEFAAFNTAPLDSQVLVAGSSQVTLNVAGTPGGAVLFAKLYDVAPSGTRTLPGAAVSRRSGSRRCPRGSPSRCPASCNRCSPATTSNSWCPQRTPATQTQAQPAAYQISLAGNSTRGPGCARHHQHDPAAGRSADRHRRDRAAGDRRRDRVVAAPQARPGLRRRARRRAAGHVRAEQVLPGWASPPSTR